MPNAVETHRQALVALPREQWNGYLVANSGLPGPRGNLELAAAVADLGDRDTFESLLAENPPSEAPVNDPREFLAFCGALGLGTVAADNPAARKAVLSKLRSLAEDPRWRMREAVAVALQRLGAADPDALAAELRTLASGSSLQRRAAIAAIADPPLLRDPALASLGLDVLDAATAALRAAPDRKAEDIRALRKGLGYAWSVVIIAAPEDGKLRFEALAREDDPDITWVVRENLKKARLARMDSDWVERVREELG